MTDHENRSSRALPREQLSRISLVKRMSRIVHKNNPERTHISNLLKRASNSSRVRSRIEFRFELDEFLLLMEVKDFREGTSMDPDPDRYIWIASLVAFRAFVSTCLPCTHSHIVSEHAKISATRRAKCRLSVFRSKFIVVLGRKDPRCIRALETPGNIPLIDGESAEERDSSSEMYGEVCLMRPRTSM